MYATVAARHARHPRVRHWPGCRTWGVLRERLDRKVLRPLQGGCGLSEVRKPWPDVAVPVVGVVELVGGLLLAIGLLTRPAAVALAADIIGALATAGRVEGGSLHLVYLPILLVCMIVLLWAGPGRLSLDERLARRAATGTPRGQGQAVAQ